MNREQFAALLEKYQQGQCTDQEKKLVEYWFALLESDVTDDVADDELAGAEQRMWSAMQETAYLPDLHEPARRGIFHPMYWRWSAIAASLLLVGWFVAGKFVGRNVPLAAYAWEERRNDGTTVMPVMLEDSSTVELAPGSSVRYPGRFEKDKRVVVLKGNAFFSIRRNPEKPFFVHSGEVTTKVLGTSFHVGTAPDGKQTKVEVVSGLVSVYSDRAANASDMLITPNHTATFDRQSGKLSTGISERPRLLNPAVSFRFRNAPLAEVAGRMRDAWGVELETENRQILSCPLTADLSGQPLFVQLDIICAALGAKYKVHGSAIRISGPGCKLRAPQAYQTRKPSLSNMQT